MRYAVPLLTPSAAEMESLLYAYSATSLAPNFLKLPTFSLTQIPYLKSSLGFCNPGRRNPVIVLAKNKKNKQDAHRFIPKPDEATGPFPEAVLLKQKKVKEDGKLLPDFADEEEQELYEYLNLELQSELNVEQMRHYEVVYLIHEKHEEEVGSLNEKVQDFLREKKGRVWRLNDWGLRRLAYRIQKANNAHYILMNFELEARWINDFKTMLDKDERVIRHLVIKRDKAIAEDCPPPPEWHTLRAGADDHDEEEDDADYDDVYEDGDWDDEEEVDTYEEDDDAITEDGIIAENKDDDIVDWTASVGNTRKNRNTEKIAR